MNKIKRNIKELRKGLQTKGSFTQNAAVMFSGSMLGTLIGLVLTPIVSRLYLPEAFGTLSIFTSLTVNLALVSTFRYTTAFVLPRDEGRFADLFRLTFILCIGFCMVLTAAVFLFKNEILGLLKAESLGNWIYLIPVAVFLHAGNDMVINLNMRYKLFKLNAAVHVVSSLSSKVFRIGYGFAFGGLLSGLIAGDLFARTAIFIMRSKQVLSKSFSGLLRGYSRIKLKAVALEYKSYPIYMLPGNWLNILSVQLPIYGLNYYFTATPAGLYGFALGLLEIPLGVILNSITPVFLQKAAEVHADTPERLKELTVKLYNRVLLIGIVPFTFLFVFGDWIFAFVFGSEWLEAGIFAGFMSLSYIFRLTSAAILPVRRVLGKESHTFYISLLLLVLRAGGFAYGIWNDSYLDAVLYFSIGGALTYFINNILALKIIKVNVAPLLLKNVGIGVASTAFFLLIKYLILSL